jgi:hypothetical protein
MLLILLPEEEKGYTLERSIPDIYAEFRGRLADMVGASMDTLWQEHPGLKRIFKSHEEALRDFLKAYAPEKIDNILEKWLDDWLKALKIK